MKHLLISALFALLGNSVGRVYNIQYLFGASTLSHEARKKKWERALARLYRDKDLLDFLYYQAESDKEAIFRGKVRKDLSVGARLRTFFLIYSARRAHLSQRREKLGSDHHARAEVETEARGVAKVYKELTEAA